MPATQDQIEGLKLISEWCKWLVTVETAAIAFIDTSVVRQSAQLVPCVKFGCGVAVLSFVCSIVVAGGTFSAIPIAVQDMEAGQRILDRDIYLFKIPVFSLYIASHLLFGLFAAGIGAFAIAVLCSLRK